MANNSAPTDFEKKPCDTNEIKSKTLPECESVSCYPSGKSGPLVAKIPVVLAEPKIQIDVEAEIKLDEPALEIKRIKKNLFLTQCRLLTLRDEKQDYGHKFGKLFLSGFVRKNIEYATIDSSSSKKGCISGDIKHTTCNVPFECVAKVEFINPPEINKSGFTAEIENFSGKYNSCGICDHPILGHDPCEKEFEHFEEFSEKVFCELESAQIIEADIFKDGNVSADNYHCEFAFQTFVEKMVIFLKLKLLQKQQVKIPDSHQPHHYDKEDKKDKEDKYEKCEKKSDNKFQW